MQPSHSNHPIDTLISEQLRMLRCKTKCSQESLAQALQIDQQILDDYEMGRKSLTIALLYEISAVLDVDLRLFLDFE